MLHTEYTNASHIAAKRTFEKNNAMIIYRLMQISLLHVKAFLCKDCNAPLLSPLPLTTEEKRNAKYSPFWMAGVFVSEYGHSVYRATAMEMSFKFFCGWAVIHLK